MMRLRIGSTLLGAALLVGCPERPVQEARALQAAGKLDRAGEKFLAAAKADPANLAAWDGAVEIWCRQHVRVGRCMEVLDLELSVLGSLQRHRDVLAEALEGRAQARIDQGMTKAALSDLDRAEKVAPERAQIQVLRARVYMAQGRRELALEALLRARKLDPHNEAANQLFREIPSGTAAAAKPDQFGGEP